MRPENTKRTPVAAAALPADDRDGAQLGSAYTGHSKPSLITRVGAIKNCGSTLPTLATLVAGIIVASSSSASAADPLNTKLGSYNGVPCYSNGYTGRWSATDPVKTVTVTVNGTKKSIVTGYQWQCVEFGKRYFALSNLTDIGGGNANSYYANATKKGLRRYKDGDKTLPKRGDLICWGGGAGGFGHVAIVRAVGVDSITVIEQNRLCTVTDASHKIGMTVTKDSTGKVTKVTIDPKGVSSKGGYWTQGWLRI